MRCQVWIGALVAALFTAAQGLAAEPCCQLSGDRFLARFAPVGGWHPYGGGLFHWWPHHCFPGCRGPNDYCRKPLPRVCWPPYPPYYTWGPPEKGCPGSVCRQASNEPY
jgi:hypothetical protein